jgi:hypothetical protein
MTDNHGDQDLDQEANEVAADAAVALVAASYLAETRGRPLSRAQRDMQVRADRLARWLVRDEQRRQGRP